MSNQDEEGSSPESLQSGESPSSAPAQSRKKQSKPSKARLTSAQKNTNHRDAENKRRDGIRGQFKELTELVPGTEGLAKSEERVAALTADHIEDELTQVRAMVQEMDAKGIPVQPEWRALVTEKDFGGPNYRTPHMDDYESKKAKAEARKGGSNGKVTVAGDGEDAADDD